MLKVLGVVLYMSAGFAVCAAYNVLDRMGGNPPIGPVTLAILFWPAFPLADALERAGVGDVD